jgi:CBS domain-containing protein
MLKASDIMKTDIVKVPYDMTVEELARVFIEKNVTGVPVLDADGKLIGMVTENDLISRNKKLHIPTVMRLFDAFIPLEGSDTMEKEIKKMSATQAGDICTRELVTIDENASLEEIATIMSEQGVHHLPVVHDGELVGVIDQHDVIKGIAGSK